MVALLPECVETRSQQNLVDLEPPWMALSIAYVRDLDVANMVNPTSQHLDPMEVAAVSRFLHSHL
jgi:hypothetical protein